MKEFILKNLPGVTETVLNESSIVLNRRGTEEYDIEAMQSSLIFPELIAIDSSLKNSNETQLGLNALQFVFSKIQVPSLELPWRFVYPSALTRSIYSNLAEDTKNNQEPESTQGLSSDMFVLQSTDLAEIGVISRSSFLPAVIEGTIEARKRLVQAGDMLILGGVQPCLRNEDVSNLQSGWRELAFVQGDLEIASLLKIPEDSREINILSIGILIDYCKALGIPENVIQIRINNPTDIFYRFTDDLPFFQAQMLGSTINELAVTSIYQDQARLANYQAQSLSIIETLLQEQQLSPESYKFLRELINNGKYNLDMLKDRPKAYQTFINLQDLVEILTSTFPKVTFLIDPLSIRYGYDGLTTQADVITPQKTFPEIGGGGAYTLAAKVGWELQFQESAPANLYMEGFAIGLKRVQTVLDFIKN